MKKVSYIWTSKIDKSCEVQEVTMCDEWDFTDWLTENGVQWNEEDNIYRAVDAWGDTVGFYEVMKVETVGEKVSTPKDINIKAAVTKYIKDQFKKITNIENTTTCIKVNETAKHLHNVVDIIFTKKNEGEKFHKMIDFLEDYLLSLPEMAVGYDIECYDNACSSVESGSDKEYERLLFETIEKAVYRVTTGKYCIAQLNDIVIQCTEIMNEYKARG